MGKSCTLHTVRYACLFSTLFSWHMAFGTSHKVLVAEHIFIFCLQPRVDQYFAHINKIISARKTSFRVRFMMQDIVDLRSNGWVPRREDKNPKTIDQIHREAADQAKKTQMAIQIARQDRRLQQRGEDAVKENPYSVVL